MLMETATNLDNVNLSPALFGKHAARKRINKLDNEDKIVTIPVPASFNNNWFVYVAMNHCE